MGGAGKLAPIFQNESRVTMYIISRTPHIIEELGLKGVDGEIKAILKVDIAVDSIIETFSTAYNEALAAQKMAQALNYENTIGLTEEETKIYLQKVSDVEEKFGKTILDLFNILFNEENTQKLLEFYDGRYTEMTASIFPFIFDVVLPEVKKANESKLIALQANYKNVKKRKRFGKK